MKIILIFLPALFFWVSPLYAQQVTCVDSYAGTTKTMSYTLPAGTNNPGPNQLNSLKTDAAGAQADMGKTFYTVMLTAFNDAAIGCANGPCENNVPGTAHRTWPLGSCVAICNVENSKCAVAKIMDRGPNTGLKCRTIDANPPLQRALGMNGKNVKATYRLLSLGSGNGRSNTCGQNADFASVNVGPGSPVSTMAGGALDQALSSQGNTAPGAFANGAAPGAFANGAAPGAFGGGSGGGSGSGSGSSGSGSGSSGGGSPGGSPSAFSPFGNPYTQQPMLGLTQPQPQTPQSPFVVTESSEGGTISSSGVATISCANRRVRFSCGAPATSSRGISSPVDSAFKTRGAMVGALRVAPATKTTYTIQCIRSQRIIDEASCAMQPNKTVDPTVTEHSDMVLTISADPQTIRRGKKTTITWSSIGAKQCTVYGYGLAGNGTDGEEQTDALQRIGSYEYVLECVHKDGSRVQEVETVIVK